ncbi:glycerophosphoryl diester phosphodiesterase membrane domain-containing protein [Anaerosalibacter massiliensis]|uniref:glycerophosphoryl diester phosphodiesterase membrane domain-containing protein n=1 Tax=Anaerosalibacter massiliensis TaxID=1347392 RepID=UPI0005B27329|nr:glycerophosphoryl diester phosphodiesterase membrane domain-containing protein [Anaerosalibacter massiliensis]
MFELMKNSLNDFKDGIRTYLVFEVIYKMITSFIFIPLITYIFHLIIRVLGSNSLLNGQVFKIGLNYKAIPGLILMLFLSTIAVFIEFGTLVIISQKKYFKKDISISDAFFTSIKKVPKIFSYGLLQLMILFLLIMPFINAPLSFRLTENMTIPKFVMDEIYKSNILSILYIIGIILVIYVFLRWVFTIHSTIIEGKKTKNAIKNSLEMTKNRKIKILFGLVLLNIIFFLIILLITFSMESLISLVISLLKLDIETRFMKIYLYRFMGGIVFVLTLLITPMNTIFLTRSYYKIKKNCNIEIVDNLGICSNEILNKIEESISKLLVRKKKLFILLVFIALIIFSAINYSITSQTIHLGRDIKIAGHRGDSIDFPENSIVGIMSAVEKGADFAEIDVQLTKDGIVVLNHDKTFKRVAGISSSAKHLNYEDLVNFDIGSRVSKRYKEEKIPKLEDVLQETKGKIKLIIDLKSYDSNKELVKAVVNLIEKYDMVEDCYIQSLNYEELKEVRRLNKNIKIGQIIIVSAGDITSLDVDFYTIEQTILSNKFVKSLHEANKEVWVWTVNEEKDINEVLQYDINGIITDYPEKIKNIIKLK